MAAIERRSVLALLASAGALTATGCSRSSSQGAVAAGDDSAVQWWDHFDPLQDALEQVFGEYSRSGGAPVERTVYNPNDMGQALQLAQGSDQLPDVFTNLFGAPAAALVDRGTVGPVTLDAKARSALDGALYEGVHTFDGKIYSVPVFTHRQHSTLTWASADLLEKAGHDPAPDEYTWDGFRALCADLVAVGVDHPWVTPLGYPDRMQEHLIDLAQAAGQAMSMVGTSGPGITDAATGEYPFAGDAFIGAMEFLRSLVVDGYMLPASTSLDAREARVRWAGGEAAIFFDGPWNAGVLSGQFESFMDTVRVVNVPSPEGGGTTERPPADGQFWCSGTSGHVEDVGTLFSLLARPEFATALAENMDQPPADPRAVDRADVPELYSRAVDIMSESGRMAPSPVVRNAAVGEVIAGMNDLHPDLGEITQGYLGGDVDDIHKELTRYCDRLAEERERSLADVRDAGSDVSLQDWIFEDHRSGDDFDATNY